jgi:hypothetical protein
MGDSDRDIRCYGEALVKASGLRRLVPILGVC